MEKKESRATEEEQDRQMRRVAAISIAIAAGVLRACDVHALTPLAVEDADVQGAYKLGAKMWKTKEVKAIFASRRQLTGAIESAIVEHRSTLCPLCYPARPH